MATQVVPVMRVRVDPNPRGSATAHVTMPAGNPFERETLSIRSANQPVLAGLPGMGAFDWANYGLQEPGTSTPSSQLSPLASNVPQQDQQKPGFWEGLVGSITQGIIKVGAAAATQELTKPKVEKLTPEQQMMELLKIKAAQPAPQQVIMAPARNYTPMILGGVALLAVGGFLLMRKGGNGGGRRRRR